MGNPVPGEQQRHHRGEQHPLPGQTRPGDDGDSGGLLEVFTWERTGGGRETVSFSCPLPEGDGLELRTFVLHNDGTLIPAQQALRYTVEEGTAAPYE